MEVFTIHNKLSCIFEFSLSIRSLLKHVGSLIRCFRILSYGYFHIFRGPSLINYLDALPPMNRHVEGPVRVPIVDRYKVRELDNHFVSLMWAAPQILY